MSKKKIVFLVGPTAVGKTAAAVKLAGKINAEIISCDSMQVYRGMDIGTQKPSLGIRKKIPHHMIDILEPEEEFSAADFRRRAMAAIKNIHKRNKMPLFVGGTGMYMKALLDGLFPAPPADMKLREKLYKQKNLYIKLEKIDPETAKNIHPNDTKKIVRALEICYLTKKKMSELKRQTKPLSDKFDVTVFGLARPREELYLRINKRVDRMFEEGLLEEAQGLLKRKLSITASQAIGYKEIWGYLEKIGKGENKGKIREYRGNIRDKGKIEEYKGEGIEGVKELIKKNTRRYAKRQITWFRADKRIKWVNGKSVISYR